MDTFGFVDSSLVLLPTLQETRSIGQEKFGDGGKMPEEEKNYFFTSLKKRKEKRRIKSTAKTPIVSPIK
jgi:hypothetical protein